MNCWQIYRNDTWYYSEREENLKEVHVHESDRQEQHGEIAVLVGLAMDPHPSAIEESERSLAELAELARAAGASVAASILQRRPAPNPATFVGRGKVEEIRQACLDSQAGLVIFDDELSGSQIRNIEQLCGSKVIDRTMLILDIFASRAQSREGKLQVELAQMQCRLSRLVGLGQSLSRLGGGIGTRGPGESQLESDRRHINRRMQFLKRNLAELSAHRSRTRAHRNENDMLTLAVVGYTNAGKSTLINRLCATSLTVADQVFATLDPAVRRLALPRQGEVLLIDTVGFIRKLPHELVDAFHSTLEEVTGSDAILEVIDMADPDAATQMAVVEALLVRLDAAGKPRLFAFNKMDSLAALVDPADPDQVDKDPVGLNPELAASLPVGRRQQAFLISARTGQGIENLVQAIGDLAAESQVAAALLIPYSEAGILDYIRQYGQMDGLDYKDNGIAVRIRIQYSHFSVLRPFIQLAENQNEQ
jgi:GTPase